MGVILELLYNVFSLVADIWNYEPRGGRKVEPEKLDDKTCLAAVFFMLAIAALIGFVFWLLFGA